MTKEQLLEMGLTEDQANKVMESLNGNFVPKTRFNEVNDAKKKLEADLATRDTQLDELKKSTGDADSLNKKIEELQTQNANDKASHEAELKQIKIDGAVEKALISAKAKNNVAVKALLNDFLKNAELDGDAIKGLDDEIKKIAGAEETKFLFNAETKPGFKGVNPGEKKDGDPGDAKPATLGDALKTHYENKTE